MKTYVLVEVEIKEGSDPSVTKYTSAAREIKLKKAFQSVFFSSWFYHLVYAVFRIWRARR